MIHLNKKLGAERPESLVLIQGENLKKEKEELDNIFPEISSSSSI